MKKIRRILITGASSGIGRALAVLYAGPGIHLLLTGRNETRLKEVEALCCEKGAVVDISTINVHDREDFESRLRSWDDLHPVDLVIANAGVSGGGDMDAPQSEAQFRNIIDINLNGTFNTVNTLVPRMKERKSGQVVLMGSMAGFRGMPNAPAYSVSKVAVRAYGDALRPLLKKHGVVVSTVFPGFVKSRITDANSFPMPFLMSAEKAAGIIKRGIDAEKPSIAFPWPMHVFCWLLGVLPRGLGDLLLSHAPKKA